MRQLILTACTWVLCTFSSAAETPDIDQIVDTHVLPGYERLVSLAQDLTAAANLDCSLDNDTLRTAYHDAFDAWVSVSHLRFGPSEQSNRAFALAFWPDTRGVTPRTLSAMIAAEDNVLETPDVFATASVAARGFYALEFLLYDPAFADQTTADYRCLLVQAIALDIERNAAAILSDWRTGYADLMRQAGQNETYRSDLEAAQQFFTSLSTGLEFTSDMRLGRPMGTFDRPRPNRAEVRRSGRSLRHVVLSLRATRDLARLLSDGDATLDAAFARSLQLANDLNDPVFAGVSTPQGRFEVEALKQSIDDIRALVATQLGPKLGVAAGFNSLDGD
ncbi:imelysin family protein [Pseudaestuariivita rosea]|uniref:imelysin family protein n=1 Tax=Pseudaestuariivita rosea TaxID=2763263 RepID=UPI001ABBB1B1|nr:imelysin family protein [Pseudaestuariivita rosea]